MIYLGIDPGLASGAWGAIDHNGNFVACGDIPAADKRIQTRALMLALRGAIPRGESAEIIIENVWVMPKQGIVSAASFMRASGAIEAVASLLLYPVTFVTPRVWKKGVGLIKADKAMSLSMAREKWPTASLNLKKHHNRAEALLLAWWGLGALA